MLVLIHSFYRGGSLRPGAIQTNENYVFSRSNVRSAASRERSRRSIAAPPEILPVVTRLPGRSYLFLLPDRFSDGNEAQRPLLDRSNRAGACRPEFRLDRWAQAGRDRVQGGTIAGIRSKLDYLKGLGVTTLWVGPIFKQRAHLNTSRVRYSGFSRCGKRCRESPAILWRARQRPDRPNPAGCQIFRPDPQAVEKPSYNGNPRHWMHSMNGRPPFRPDRGLLPMA